jgi:hypothetical protein
VLASSFRTTIQNDEVSDSEQTASASRGIMRNKSTETLMPFMSLEVCFRDTFAALTSAAPATWCISDNFDQVLGKEFYVNLADLKGLTYPFGSSFSH